MNENTQRDIAQNKMNADIMLMLGNVQGTVQGIKEKLEELTPIITDHEKRIGNAEEGISNIQIRIGFIGAIFGGVFSFAFNWIWQKLTGHSH